MVKERIENETKEEKFKRIATKRANRLLEEIRRLGNCSNKSVYAYDEKQINQLFSTIEQEIKQTKSLFNHNIRKKITL